MLKGLLMLGKIPDTASLAISAKPPTFGTPTTSDPLKLPSPNGVPVEENPLVIEFSPTVFPAPSRNGVPEPFLRRSSCPPWFQFLRYRASRRSCHAPPSHHPRRTALRVQVRWAWQSMPMLLLLPAAPPASLASFSFAPHHSRYL